MNRRQRDEQRKLNATRDRAIQKSRQPGDSTYGTSSTSEGGTATISTAIIGSFTEPDEDGNTLHDFMLGVDTLGEPYARLRVRGVKTRLYG